MLRLACSLFVSSLLLLVSTGAHAGAITVVSQADTWNYNFGSSLGPGGTSSATYATFTSNYTGTSIGQAPFGNTNVPGAPYNTGWVANNALYAQIAVNLAGTMTGTTTLNLAVDNGAAVWVNGNLAFQATAGGFTSIWEYSTSVNNSFFVNGLNTISVIANDWGGGTYFDMELTGDLVAAVPEPAPLMLLGSGLALLGLRRKLRVKAG